MDKHSINRKFERLLMPDNKPPSKEKPKLIALRCGCCDRMYRADLGKRLKCPYCESLTEVEKRIKLEQARDDWKKNLISGEKIRAIFNACASQSELDDYDSAPLFDKGWVLEGHSKSTRDSMFNELIKSTED